MPITVALFPADSLCTRLHDTLLTANAHDRVGFYRDGITLYPENSSGSAKGHRIFASLLHRAGNLAARMPALDELKMRRSMERPAYAPPTSGGFVPSPRFSESLMGAAAEHAEQAQRLKQQHHEIEAARKALTSMDLLPPHQGKPCAATAPVTVAEVLSSRTMRQLTKQQL